MQKEIQISSLRQYFSIIFCPVKWFGTATVTLRKPVATVTSHTTRRVKAELRFNAIYNQLEVYIPLKEVEEHGQKVLVPTVDKGAHVDWYPLSEPLRVDVEVQRMYQATSPAKHYEIELVAA